MDFNDPLNRGLPECIAEYKIDKAYEEHCGRVSLADFIVIAAEAAMGRTSPTFN